MRRALLACAVVGAFSVLGASAAEAGGLRISFGVGGRGSHYGHGHSNYGYNRVGYNRGYFNSCRPSYFSRSYYHDTSHYDYHPGEFVPHGDHYHYQPGHYDYHRTGHWHHR